MKKTTRLICLFMAGAMLFGTLFTLVYTMIAR